MKKLIVSEYGEQILDLTAEEISNREQEAIQAEANRVAIENKKAEELANKKSALIKLKALGLNDAEIKAILGN